MENIKRKIKIFWVEHSDPILFYTILIVAVIAIVQILNQLAIQNSKKDINENNAQNEKVVYKKDEKDVELIKKFVNYCKEEKIEQAYGLLSEKCKKELYPTIEDFTNKYYNKIFKQKRNIEIKYENTNDLYSITFVEDILEAGKIENRDNIKDHYKIEQEVIDKKIYINFNQEIK